MARFVFLGRLEDIAGTVEMIVTGGASLAALIDGLGPDLRAALASPRIRIAVNGMVVAGDQALEDIAIAEADEIAFLPPVSGG